jgi:hypothetical protein
MAKKVCPFQNLLNAKLALGLAPSSQTLGSLLRAPLAGKASWKNGFDDQEGLFWTYGLPAFANCKNL